MRNKEFNQTVVHWPPRRGSGVRQAATEYITNVSNAEQEEPRKTDSASMSVMRINDAAHKYINVHGTIQTSPGPGGVSLASLKTISRRL